MIEIGTLVKWRTGDMGIVTETHDSDHSRAYRIKWFDGGMGILSAWQFEVVA